MGFLDRPLVCAIANSLFRVNLGLDLVGEHATSEWDAYSGGAQLVRSHKRFHAWRKSRFSKATKERTCYSAI